MPVKNDHVQLDHVTIQGLKLVFARDGKVDIANSTITGTIGSLPYGAGLEADTSATLHVRSSMVTSNSSGIRMYSGSTAPVGASTVVADNARNVGVCGGPVRGREAQRPHQSYEHLNWHPILAAKSLLLAEDAALPRSSILAEKYRPSGSKIHTV